MAAWRATCNPDQEIKSKLPKWAHGIGLSASALNVLGCLHYAAIIHGQAQIANLTLAQRLDRHEGSISRVLTECQRKGVILPVYFPRIDHKGKKRDRRFILTCCLASVRFVKSWSTQDWLDLKFAPKSGANGQGVLEGVMTFVERCEMLTGSYLGQLRQRLAMEGDIGETILDFGSWGRESVKTPSTTSSFSEVRREGVLNENVNICIHSDFQSEMNKEANAAGGVASDSTLLPDAVSSERLAALTEPQAASNPPPGALAIPALDPAPNPPVASTPLPVEAKKRGGGKFEAEHPGVMARLRALCGGDTDASWNAGYTRAVQVFAKVWNMPHGPGDQELQLLESHLPAARIQNLRLAELVHADQCEEGPRTFWSSPVRAAAAEVVNPWDVLQCRMMVFRAGALKDGQHMHMLRMGTHEAAVSLLEKCDGLPELLDRVSLSEVDFVGACFYLFKFGQRSRLAALHARYASCLTRLCLADWEALLSVLTNFDAEKIRGMLGVSAECLVALARCHYLPLRSAARAFEEQGWIRHDPRTSILVSEGDFITSLEQADNLMEQIKIQEPDVVSPQELAEVEAFLKSMNLPLPPSCQK